MGIIYLACPYTSDDPNVCDARYNVVTDIAARMVLEEKIVFSPITMTHPFDRIIAAPGTTLGSDYWVNFDIAFMNACEKIIVVKLPGWDESSGIAREIKYFESEGKPVEYLDPRQYSISNSDPRFAAAWPDT